MGFNQSSSSSSSFTTTTTKDLFGAVLAGFGIWTKPLSTVPPEAKPQLAPCNVYPLRIVRVKDANPQMAGRMVISGRMADVCAELDRMVA
jgi:hypothetical protein